jgi:hypothetical protein
VIGADQIHYTFGLRSLEAARWPPAKTGVTTDSLLNDPNPAALCQMRATQSLEVISGDLFILSTLSRRHPEDAQN